MKIKKHILTLSLILATVAGFAQNPYNLPYNPITLGNKADGKIVLNGSNIQMPRIGLGSPTDSVLTIFNGVIKKVPKSSITSPTPSLDQVLNVGFTSELPISVGAVSAGSGSITSAPTQPTNIVRLSDLSAYQPISSAVTSVNGRTGAVIGLAEASSLANYMDLTTNQTAAGNKTFTNNVATGGTLMVGSASGNNMFFDNSGSGYMSFSARNNGAGQGMNWNAAEFFFNGKMSFPSGLLEYPSFTSGNFVFNNARTAGSMLFQNNGVNRLELTSSLSSFTGPLRVSANDGNANSAVRNSDIANKANLTGGNNFVGAQNIKGVLSINPATGTYPFIQIADNGNLTAFESATAQIGINGSTGRLAFTRGGFTGTINNPTLTANRTWNFPDQAGTFLLDMIEKKSNGTTGSPFYENIIRYGLGTTSSAIKGFNSYADNFGTGLAFYVNPTATANTETLSMRLNADASADFTNSVRASANDGNANTLVRNTDLSNYALKTPVFSTAGTSATLVSSGRYIPQNASLTIYTLPTTAAVGDVIFINGKGSGGWRISQNTGQVIHGATDTTTGSAGYVGSTARYNSIAIVCVTANTEWIIQSSQGSLTIN